MLNNSIVELYCCTVLCTHCTNCRCLWNSINPSHPLQLISGGQLTIVSQYTLFISTFQAFDMQQILSGCFQVSIIDEGFNQKTRQRSSCRIGGQNPRCASCFAQVFLKQTVEFNHPPCRASCFASVFLKKMVEFKDSSPNPT